MFLNVVPRGLRVGTLVRLQSLRHGSSVSKVVDNIDDALKGIKSGSTLLSGGFGLCGLPETLIEGLLAKKDVTNITAVSNNAGIDHRGLSKLLESGQITKMVSSFIGSNKTFEKMYLEGKIDLELCPQGNLAERVRAGSAGIPAYYTATGANTWLEEGKLPVRYNSEGDVIRYTEPRETREFAGKKYLLEHAIYGDVAFVKAYKADTLGNCWFKGSARNFNSVFGKGAKLTIVEAENIVEPGEIQAEDVHLPGVYVSRVIQSTARKDIEIYKNSTDESSEDVPAKELSEIEKKRVVIAKRATQEIKDGVAVNLGIGIPTLAANYLPAHLNVDFQSENGILGVGPYPRAGEEDADLINAGKETVTLKPGASLFGSEESFSMIRSGRVGLTLLGALQVSEFGDLANWGLPGRIKGMGGAMDLVSNPQNTRVVILMEHVDKKGRSKIVRECKFPLTGARCVSRIITDLAVFDVDPEGGLTLIEVSKNSSVEDVRTKTEAAFKVSENLKVIAV